MALTSSRPTASSGCETGLRALSGGWEADEAPCYLAVEAAVVVIAGSTLASPAARVEVPTLAVQADGKSTQSKRDSLSVSLASSSLEPTAERLSSSEWDNIAGPDPPAVAPRTWVGNTKARFERDAAGKGPVNRGMSETGQHCRTHVLITIIPGG